MDVSSDRGGQKDGLRGDKEEPNYGGEKISFSLKSSNCGCLALIRTMLRSVLSLLKLMLDSMAVSNDL